MRKLLFVVWGVVSLLVLVSLPVSALGIHSQETGDEGSIYLPFVSKPAQPTPTPTLIPTVLPPIGPDWPMVAANPQRSSWTSEEVTGNLRMEWYRPIEAYISQNVQIIAAQGNLYVATARGLIVLNAANGQIVWRYDTAMPLGNSPTVANGVVYFGGYDRKLYALNAANGALLWSYDGAQDGYDTNPLVVDGKVILGNRDGAMYAIGAHGSANAGQLVWKYQTGGPIHLSAAYQNGIVYFAANDNYAYALRTSNGALVWKSAKLPGDGYQSYWPVIFRDKVVFAAAVSYRPDMNPGTLSANDGTNKDFRAIWSSQSEGALVGSQTASQEWAHGFPAMNAHSLTEYYEDSPASSSNPYTHKPWRRAFVVLNQSDGREFTFDSDGDGYREYAPVFWWMTNSGNLYPGIVGPDNILYHNNLFSGGGDPKGKVYGWNPDMPGILSMVGSTGFGTPAGGFGAMAEPQSISGGGNVVYRNLCCDRLGDWFSISSSSRGQLWSYNLHALAAGYDSMWFVYPESISRLWAWYQGAKDYYQDSNVDPHNYNSVNGIYASHGVQNPIIPYSGRLYVHRGNAIIAFGTGSGPGKLPPVTIQNAPLNSTPLSSNNLTARLETQVQKIVDAGHLRPGYYVIGQHADYAQLASYFDNPGETLYTLAAAYPYLSSGLKNQVKTYLASEFQNYFGTQMYVTIGWSGAAREAMPLPDDIAASLNGNPIPPSLNPGARFSWSYPPFNFYAMHQYAKNVAPENVSQIYSLAKGKINAVLNNSAAVSTNYLREKPFEHNAYMSGYIGFLNLQQQAGMSGTDAALRTQVNNELNRLLQLKYSIFDKDTWWVENTLLPGNNTQLYQRKEMDIARNFMWLVPELGDYFNANLRSQVQQALEEYNYVAPYWFVSRYESFPGEGSSSTLWNYPALFQAKAYILDEPRSTLTAYLDAPAFERGDLFYLQNLVAALQAAP